MANPEDFRCDDCGAPPESPCIYIWPAESLRPYEIVVYREGNRHRWERHPIPWDGYREYRVQVLEAERWIQIGGGEIEWSVNPKHSHYSGPLAKQYAKVGTPTKQPHRARSRALYDWEQQAERDALQEYLREWLGEFGDIFQTG